jgi:hypothetical protein
MKYYEKNKDEHRNVSILACDDDKGSDVLYIVSGADIQMKQHRMESHDASKEGQNMSGCRNGAHPVLLYCSLFYSYNSSSLGIQQGVFIGVPIWQKINRHPTESRNFNG